MIARAEIAASNYGDRCPSLGRRAKTNKRVPPVVLDRFLLLLLRLFGYLHHERSSRSRRAARVPSRRGPTRRFVSDPRTWSPAGRIDSKMRFVKRRTIDVRPRGKFVLFLLDYQKYTYKRSNIRSNFTSSSEIVHLQLFERNEFCDDISWWSILLKKKNKFIHIYEVV